MFDQAKAPLRVLDQPTLGEPVLMLSESMPSGPPTRSIIQTDPRVDLLQQRLDIITWRVEQLEAQTPRAYWLRFVQWLRGLWPWR
jgi:hypothetical protein